MHYVFSYTYLVCSVCGREEQGGFVYPVVVIAAAAIVLLRKREITMCESDILKTEPQKDSMVSF